MCRLAGIGFRSPPVALWLLVGSEDVDGRIHGVVDRVVGDRVVHRVLLTGVVHRVVGGVVHRIILGAEPTGEAAGQIAVDVTDAALVAIDVGGGGVVVLDHQHTPGPTAGAAAITATTGQDAPTMAAVPAGGPSAATDGGVVDHRALIVRDDVPAGLLVGIIDLVVLTDNHRRTRTGVDVAGAGGVVIAVLLDRTVGQDVAVVVAVDDHPTVGGGVGGLVAEGDVTESQIQAVIDIGVGLRAQKPGVVMAERVVVGQHLGLTLRDESDAVSLGHRLLQPHHRITTTVQHRRRRHRSGHRLHLCRGHVRDVGCRHRAAGI